MIKSSNFILYEKKLFSFCYLQRTLTFTDESTDSRANYTRK